MYEQSIAFRNAFLRFFYKYILKPIFFLSDPEKVHDSMIHKGVMLGRSPLLKRCVRFFFFYKNTRLEQNVKGIVFKNPVGLSAGFDKDAELTDILPAVGFGFVEVGSITGEPCKGNPKPRLWRLLKSKSLVVYYGLKNQGCEIVAGKLMHKKFEIPVGMSIAMTNCQENMILENAIADFSKAFRTMEPYGAYSTINISCPNTCGGQPFVDPQKFDALFQSIDTIPTNKPIFIKLSPDLSSEQIDALLDVARTHRIDGIICTNLTKKRPNPHVSDDDVPVVGGMSGMAVQDLSDKLLAYIYKREGKRFILMGCGGVFTAEDAYKKIRLGATLIQMITGMIFEGPQVISEINQGLVKLLVRDGFASIADAIGVDTIG